MNINVAVTDANNIVCEVTPTPQQVITIDRGVAGNGIESISVVLIDGDEYLHIVFTNGTTSDVGPISATYYTGTSPIVVNNTTNVISLDVVPVTLGGTNATTASGARTNLGLGTAAVLNAGVANGVATLDAGGTVPLSQIPASIQGGVSYQGTWNASTNTPTLTSSVGTKGYYYVVSVAGSTNLNGIIDWQIGDWAIYSGTAWQKIDNTDAVTSVNGFTGTVVLNAANVGALSIANNLSDLASATTARTNLGLGSIATQNANSVAITGGAINGTTIGATTASSGAFTTVTASTAIGIASGGTGQTTANAAFNALAPSQTGNSGKYLTTDGSNTSWATNPLGTVTSVDVSGGTTGLTTSGGPITTSGTITLAGTLATTNGGTGLTSFTSGGVVYASSTSALATGSALTWNGTTFAVNSSAAGALLTIGSGGTSLNYYDANTHVFRTGGFSELMRILASGNVGIGTSSPAYKLDVTGNGNFTSLLTLAKGSSQGLTIGDVATNSNSVLRMQGTSAGYNWQIANNLNVGGLEFTPSTATGGTTYTTPAMALTTTGLGIGTNSPSTKLHVKSADNTTASVIVENLNNTNGILQFGSASSSYQIFGGAYQGQMTYNTGAGTPHIFWIGGSEKLRLDGSGNLGIGTSSPSTFGKLAVAGNVVPTVTNSYTLGTSTYAWSNIYATNITVGGYSVVDQTDIGTAANEIPLNQYLGNLAYQDAANIAGPVGIGGAVTLSSGTANGVAYLNASKVLTTGSTLTFDGTTTLGIAGGNVGFSATTGNLYLDAASGSTANLRVGGYSASISILSTSEPIFRVNSTELMRLTSTGLGIGTSSPSVKLDVVGQGRILYNTGATNTGDQTVTTIGATTTGAYASSYGAGLQFQVTNSSGGYSGGRIVSRLGSDNFTANLVFQARNYGYTDSMTLDPLGNLVIGATPVGGTAKLDVTASSTYGIWVRNGFASSTPYGLEFGLQPAHGSYRSAIRGAPSNYGGDDYGMLLFYTSDSYNTGALPERARITAGGSLCINQTTNSIGSNAIKLAIYAPTPYTGTGGLGIRCGENTTGGIIQTFANASDVKMGSITVASSGSGVAYNTSSDYRLKNTIAPMTGALAKVALLKPCTYKWNADGSDGEGFIAHELAEVCPHAVTGEKDAINEDGSIKPQGIDTSFLVATLTAALQELNAKFDAYVASHP